MPDSTIVRAYADATVERMGPLDRSPALKKYGEMLQNWQYEVEIMNRRENAMRRTAPILT